MVPLSTVERGFIGVGGFVLLLLLESVWPFCPRVESRWRRYAINLFIAGSNALLIGLPEYPSGQDVTFSKVLAMPFGLPCGEGHGARPVSASTLNGTHMAC